MKKSRYTDSQILAILKQAESGKPLSELCREHGMSSATFIKWAAKKGIHIEYIQPGNPQQNAYIERHNRTIRSSWLNKHLFESIEEVQDIATKWLWFYNHERPHKANGGKPPLMVA